MSSESFKLGRDPPSLLFKQLVANGFAIIDNPVDSVTLEASEVLGEWFQLPHHLKQKAATKTANTAGGARGYFSLPDKEVLEVKQDWRIKGLQSDVRLVVHEVYTGLQKAAASALQALFASNADSGLHATEQQVQAWMGQPAARTTGSSSSSSSSSSVLHVSSYKSSSAGAPHVLGGSEAHVDRGLLTLVADTGPGLEVLAQDGSWVPVSPSAHQLVVLVGHTLHWATAGRLPAAKHRIATPAPGSSSSSSSSSGAPRLSVAFKLRAAAGAEFAPATITGTPSSELDSRYRARKRTHELMAAFDASHLSIHHSRVEQQQQQQQQLISSKRPCADDGSAPDQQRKGKVISLRIKDQQGHTAVFNVKEGTQMGRVFAAYGAKMGIDVASLRFIYTDDRSCGVRRLSQNDTPRQLMMEDGDIVRAVMEQLGD